MATATSYEEQILKELKELPEEALPKVLRFLILLREEFFTEVKRHSRESAQEKTNHERTRQLLGSSKGNWAQDLIAEREERL
jgi:hypothetical protein